MLRRRNIQRRVTKKKTSKKKRSTKTKLFEFKVNGIETKIVSKQVSETVTNFKVIQKGARGFQLDFNVNLDSKKLTYSDGTEFGKIKLSRKGESVLEGGRRDNKKQVIVPFNKSLKEVSEIIKKKVSRKKPSTKKQNDDMKYMAWCLITISICATLCFGIYYYSHILEMSNAAAQRAVQDYLLKHEALHLENLDKIALRQIDFGISGINGVVSITNAFLPQGKIADAVGEGFKAIGAWGK